MSHPGFRSKIEKDGEFSPEKGRYLLYVSLSCPYAHRTLISHALKGLQDVVPIIRVHPVQAPLGDGLRSWVIGGHNDIARPPAVENDLKAAAAAEAAGTVLPPALKEFIHDINFHNTTCAGVDVTDPIANRKLIKDMYDQTDSTYDGKWTVPILWDTKSNKIVNNDSADICGIFDSAFDQWALTPAWTMKPAEISAETLKATLDKIQAFMVKPYQILFSPSQIEYYLANSQVYQFLESLELELGAQRFVAGSVFSEADIRLVVVLLRFDPVLAPLAKICGKRVADFPAISGYLRDVFQNVFDDNAKAFWSEAQSRFGAFSFSPDQKGIVPLTRTVDLTSPVDRTSIGKTQ